MDLPNHPMIRQDAKVGSMPACDERTMIPAKGFVVPQPIAGTGGNGMQDASYKKSDTTLRPGAQRMGRIGG